MHTDELETFLTLVREKSFTKTAVKRALSQPTVSVHIKNLENEFETSLFKRTTKHLNLTGEGELFYEKALQMMAIYNNTQETFYRLKKQAIGIIRIGASFSIGEYVLPQILSGIRATHSKLDFEIMIGNTEEIVSAVRRLEVDIGVVEGHSESKEVIQIPFKEDRLWIVRTPNEIPLTKVDDLHDQAWIIRENGSGTRNAFEHLISSNGIRIGSKLIISSTQGIKESVKNGLGISLLSEATIREELRYQSLEIVDIEGLFEKRQFKYVLTKGTDPGKNINIFIQHLQSS